MIKLQDITNREELVENQRKAIQSCDQFANDDSEQGYNAYMYWHQRIGYWQGRIASFDIEAKRKAEAEKAKVKPDEIYSKRQLNSFRDLAGQLIMDLVNMSLEIKAVRTMDTMSIIDYQAPGLRCGSIHFHPDRRVTMVSGWNHISVDKDMTDDPAWCAKIVSRLEDRGWKVDKDAIN